MLYLVGLGIFDENDLTLKGLEILKKSDAIYAEFYTSPWAGSLEKLETLSGRRINVLNRKELEECPEENVLKDAGNRTISLLIPGDPLVATTHMDIVMRAEKAGVRTAIVHSSSVYSAIGETGLQLYKFGKTTTLGFPQPGYEPTSPYTTIARNKKAGLHTLVLLDIKEERGKYMTVGEGIRLLLDMEKKEKQGMFTENTLCVGVARLGGDTKIKSGNAKELLGEDFGKPPHVVVVPGELHFMEKEALERFKV